MISKSPTVRSGEPTELRMLVGKIKDLPTVPSVLTKLVSLSIDSALNADSLADIVGIDQTISAKLLRIANSAFYGCRGKVSSVSRAIMILGFSEVKSLALGMSIFQAFSNTGGKGGADKYGKVMEALYCRGGPFQIPFRKIAGKIHGLRFYKRAPA